MDWILQLSLKFSIESQKIRFPQRQVLVMGRPTDRPDAQIENIWWHVTLGGRDVPIRHGGTNNLSSPPRHLKAGRYLVIDQCPEVILICSHWANSRLVVCSPMLSLDVLCVDVWRNRPRASSASRALGQQPTIYRLLSTPKVLRLDAVEGVVHPGDCVLNNNSVG